MASAQNNLGLYYANGKGVPKANVLAYMWINIAGVNGRGVEEVRVNLTEEMSQAGIAKAQEKCSGIVNLAA